MKRSVITLLFVALVAFAGAGVAKAEVVTLTFEGVGDLQPVGDYYNGGAGGSYGIYFSPNAVGLVDNDAGGSGTFGGEPSPETVLSSLSGRSRIMTVLDGFSEGLSFYYSAIVITGSIVVYSGLEGTGDILAQVTLPRTPIEEAPDPTGLYSPFLPFGVDFEGTAYSVGFEGQNEFILFDDITLNLNRQGPNGPQPAPTPEPGTMLLMGAGLLGMLGMRRRFKK